ncbi:MAG: translation elongation factor Ts [Reinekea forsetii]|nr:MULTISPECIES: translation elongation factor Ts [Reinekea]MDO7642936.1 translation elongation factor Ts [Reinekea forsetii]MDO7645056.1 translation elongation factor Ts [Reinekea forsetii]MDO7674455.1 translation elongation factor Ts [Reinekea forsetii]
MMAITASLVKELRDRTGLGMMECKKALVESEGDIELAIDNLRKSSGLKAAKKSGRIAAEGILVTRTSADNSLVMLLEINSETDFVARDDNFLNFAHKVADVAFAKGSSDVAAFMADGLEDERAALVQKIGENISVRRAVFIGGAGKTVEAYVHGGRIAAAVELTGGTPDLAKDIAMHVAAINPQYVNVNDVPADVLAREEEVVRAQSEESGKPAEIIEKMMVGRLKKFVAEISLSEQPFIKDPDIKIGALAKKAEAEIVSFTRFEVGEGIEKEVVDFAAEVAAAVKGG